MEMAKLHTIKNIVKVALEEFDDVESTKFISFMLQRFGDGYQVESYVKKWAERIKNKSLWAMDSHTLAVYNEVYREVKE